MPTLQDLTPADIIERQGREALRSLGVTPKEVAIVLISQGIKGQPVSATSCPLANYLTQKTGVTWTVGLSFAGFHNGRGVIPLPYACERFRQDFDDGRYPELIGVVTPHK